MRIAAIDIGTNSLHMIICRVRPDQSFEVIDREKDMIRLGAGGLDGRRLAEPAIAAAIQTLSKFTRIATAQGAEEVCAVATSAVREAENGGDFVAAVRREVGLHVQVISGTEEARLIHLAAAYAVDVGRKPAVVIDIGGGSTEITLGTAERMQVGRSFKIGVIRLTERFITSDPVSEDDARRLVRHVRREAGSYLKQLAKRHVSRFIGTSGTILSLGALATGTRPNEDARNRRVSVKGIRRLRKELLGLTLEERLALPGLDPRRADLSPAGVLLLDTLLDGLAAQEIVLCDYALREGVILDYVRRNAAHIRTVERYPDVRRRSVIELGERCNYLAAHAAQVAKLSLSIFDGTKARHGLGQREREWLEYGALLHDIGTHISYERHHKHSEYLIRNGGLRGFDPEEVELVGLITRYHRQTTPKRSHDTYASLSRDLRRAVRVLGAIVRLAEGLDRSHAQVVSKASVRSTDATLTIRLDTRGDASIELWVADRHATALAEELGSAITIELSGQSRLQAQKDKAQHARHPRHSPRVPRPSLRRRGHRRIGQDHATRSAR